METKEAIKFMNMGLSCVENDRGIKQSLNGIIELLQRGEKYKKMWEAFKWKEGDFPMDECIDIAAKMDFMKQKYFPKGGLTDENRRSG